jgi:5-methylcytosine-specific restriction endonuclease McrA
MKLIRDIKDRLSGRVPPGTKRAGGWHTLQKKVIANVGKCEACPSKKKLEVHHVLPFHLNPERELDVTNLIVLCRRCHQFLGHLDDWKAYNPFVRKDAEILVETKRLYE